MAFDFLGIAPYRFCMAMRNIALMTMIGLALARIAGGTYTPSTEIVWAYVGQISTVYVIIHQSHVGFACRVNFFIHTFSMILAWIL